MRILVTGHRGNLGVPIARHLDHLGHDVVGFDRVDGQDLLDLVVNRAAVGCAAIVHLGALAHDTAGSQEQIMAVNVLGTWHVLLAAETAGAARVIHFSSAQVFGIAEGERLPDYFPVDDAHPRRAIGAYGLSKCLGEDLCAAFTARTGIPSMSLRPVAVWDPGEYQRTAARWRAEAARRRPRGRKHHPHRSCRIRMPFDALPDHAHRAQISQFCTAFISVVCLGSEQGSQDGWLRGLARALTAEDLPQADRQLACGTCQVGSVQGPERLSNVLSGMMLSRTPDRSKGMRYAGRPPWPRQ